MLIAAPVPARDAEYIRVSETQRVYKVLMAEDDRLTAHIYSRELKKNGFNVVVVEDGLSVVDRFFEVQPDCVLVDIMMPRLNGIEAIKAIRAVPNTHKTPIIATTNAFVPMLIENADAAGADWVCNKSKVTPGELADRFKALLFDGSRSAYAG